MKIGLQIPSFTWPGGSAKIAPKLAEIARTADTAGFASVWVMDHFFQLGGWVGPAESDMLESYSTLAFLAGCTKNVRLGALVTGVIYRHPGLLAKTVTTLDVLSGGRANLGIGAAWYEREALALGVPFPPLKERFERLEEALHIVLQMWSGDNGPFAGKYYQLAETLNVPQVLSQPRPPILIGGGGEQKTLRLVARYADACNLFGRLGSETLRAKLQTLQRHCDAEHRDYAAIEKTALETAYLAPGQMSSADIIKQLHALAALGFSHVIFNMPNVHEITPLETFGAEIIPAVAGL